MGRHPDPEPKAKLILKVKPSTLDRINRQTPLRKISEFCERAIEKELDALERQPIVLMEAAE